MKVPKPHSCTQGSSVSQSPLPFRLLAQGRERLLKFVN